MMLEAVRAHIRHTFRKGRGGTMMLLKLL